MVGLVFVYLGYLGIKLLYKAWLRYEAGKDRSYNVFDKAEFTH